MTNNPKRQSLWFRLAIVGVVLACCATLWRILPYDSRSRYPKDSREWEREQRAILEQIEEFGGEIYFNKNFVEIGIGPQWRGGERGLRLLAQLDELEEVTLEGPAIDDDALRVVTGVQSLTALHLMDTSITAAGVQQVAQMDCLLVLELNGLDLADDDLAFLTGLHVKWLLIEGSPEITDAGLAHLKGIANKLLYLKIAGAKISGKGLSDLGEMHNLRALLLPGCAVDSPGLRSLNAPILACLDLSRTRVSGAGLGRLKDFHKLRELKLDDTRIGDDALRRLAEFNSLEVLSLNGTPVTDAGLAHLEGILSLKVLGLERTGVTTAAIDKLKGAVELQTVVSGIPER